MQESSRNPIEAGPVRFGIFDWIDSNGENAADLYEQRLKYLEYADAAGFYCYHMAEHQGTPLGMAPSPSVFLSAAAQRTKISGWDLWYIPCPSTIPSAWWKKSACLTT